MLPVSSSGHLALVPRLLRWPYSELEPELRKSFEVALHAGSGAALAIVLRRELASLTPRDTALLALTLGPPAAAGLLLERTIERRLGGPASVAMAQVAAGAAMWAADRTPERRAATAGADHLAVGLGQAAALVPGVSRAGASITALRARGLARGPAARLSRLAALPVSLGAAVLKAFRAQVPRELAAPFLAGAGAAFVATIAAGGLARRLDPRGLGPLAAYRVALGVLALLFHRR